MSEIQEDDDTPRDAAVPCRIQLADSNQAQQLRVVQLGEGDEFDFVLVQPTGEVPTRTEPKGSLKGVAPAFGDDLLLGKNLMACSDLAIPQDLSQQMGQLETAVVLLSHLERLALPHLPKECWDDVDQTVCNVLAILDSNLGKDPREMETQETEPSPDPGASATALPLGKCESIRTLQCTGNPDISSIQPSSTPCLRDVRKDKIEQPLNIMTTLQTQEWALYCVDASPEVFQYFLNLVYNIQEVSSVAVKGRPPGLRKIIAGRRAYNDNISQLDGQVKALKDDVTRKRVTKNSSHFPGSLLAHSSKLFTLRLLRCTLRVLKVNLFYLVRATAIRSACRSSKLYWSHSVQAADGGALEVSHRELKEEIWGTQEEEALHSSRSAYGGSGINMCQRPGGRRHAGLQSMDSIVENLRTLIWCLLESGDDACDNDEVAKATGAVQAEAAEMLSIGFSIFYPTTLSRSVLLRDVARLGLAQPNCSDTIGRAQSLKLSTPRHLGLKVILESLSQDCYVASLVAGLFKSEARGANESCTLRQTHLSGRHDHLTPGELGSIMESLLAHSSRHLQECLWGPAALDSKRNDGGHFPWSCGCAGDSCRARVVEHHNPKLLKTLQVHMISSWAVQEPKYSSLRETVLLFSKMLLAECHIVLDRLLTEMKRVDRHTKVNCLWEHLHIVLRDSFLELVPLLCASLVSIPFGGKDSVALVLAVLPPALPLLEVVNSLISMCECATGIRNTEPDKEFANDHKAIPCHWQESLAMLATDLACRLISEPHFSGPTTVVGQQLGTKGRSMSAVDMAEVMLLTSPFLHSGYENYTWSSASGQSHDISQDYSNFIQVSEVEVSPGVSRESTPSVRLGHTSVGPRHRRSTGDRGTRLSPIDPHEAIGHAKETSGTVEVLGGAVSGGGKLDSIVDDKAMEDFLQDLLCGRGTAQAMYQWMISPSTVPAPQAQVLHAASLATQGQGWGSYQSLGSYSSTAEVDTHEKASTRKGARALVIAAARSVAAVILKSNGLVGEAVTFSRCRLDKASSPPRALKLVSAAVAEIHEALVDFKESQKWEVASNITEVTLPTGSIPKDNACAEPIPGRDPLGGQSRQSTLLSGIVSNCDFLLKSRHLPSINLTSNSCRTSRTVQMPSNMRRERLSHRLSQADQETLQEVCATLRGWVSHTVVNEVSAVVANTNGPKGFAKAAPQMYSENGSLATILAAMGSGNVYRALEEIQVSQKGSGSWMDVSLEHLMVCVASPILLEELGRSMKIQELRAKMRATGLKIVQTLIYYADPPAALGQIVSRLDKTFDHCSCIQRNSMSPSRNLNGISIFGDLGGAGPVPITILHGVFVGLYNDVAQLVINEHNVHHQQDGPQTRKMRRLPVLLTLLQTLSAKFTPTFLQHTKISGWMEECPINLGEGPARNSRTDVSPSVHSQHQSFPSASAGVLPNSTMSNEISTRESPISVICRLIPVLGQMLTVNGDILTPTDNGVRAATGRGKIHRTVWHTFQDLCTHLCSVAELVNTWAPASKVSVGVTRDTGCATSSYTWWDATNAVLNILVPEAKHVQLSLLQLLKCRRAQEQAQRGADGQTLLASPVYTPLAKSTTKFKRHTPLAKVPGRGFGFSFWLWIPRDPVHGQLLKLRKCSKQMEGLLAVTAKAMAQSSREVVGTVVVVDWSRHKACIQIQDEAPTIEALKNTHCNSSG
ncbi:unnamed protein product [Choristocarpus tenellus]